MPFVSRYISIHNDTFIYPEEDQAFWYDPNHRANQWLQVQDKQGNILQLVSITVIEEIDFTFPKPKEPPQPKKTGPTALQRIDWYKDDEESPPESPCNECGGEGVIYIGNCAISCNCTNQKNNDPDKV